MSSETAWILRRQRRPKSKVRNLLEQKDAYHDKIEKIVEEYVYNLGNSAEVGAKYIVQAVQEQIKKAKEQ